MKIRFYVLSLLLFCAIATAGAQRLPTLDDKPLKEVFASHFLFGVAVNNRQVSGRDLDGQTVVRHHFNSIVAENCMKSSSILRQRLTIIGVMPIVLWSLEKLMVCPSSDTR